MPTVPAGMVVVVMTGGGTRVTVAVAVLVGSLIDVAVMTTVVVVVTLTGALYVTPVVVAPLREPGPLVMVQFTPALLASLATVAVMAKVLPWSRDCDVADVIVTEGPTLVAQPVTKRRHATTETTRS